MGKQRGVSLIGAIVVLGALALIGLGAAKMLPSYIDYFNVKKIFASMESAGDLKGSVKDIRKSFDRRNAVEDVKGVSGEDLEISKEGGETILTATWSVKVPLVSNVSVCVDFVVTTAK